MSLITTDSDSAILVNDAFYTEGPRWHGNALWFSEAGKGQVRRVTRDGKTLIVSELMAHRVLKFDILPDGGLSEQQVFFEVDSPLDCLCIDSEDAIWRGATGSCQFRRYDRSGALTDAVTVPDWSAIACALGGPDGRPT